MSYAFKKVTENDLELLMHWRMRKDIDKMMCSAAHLTLQTQCEWFERIKDSKKEIRLVIWKDNKAIGTFNFIDIDHENKRCETGWYLADKEGVAFSDVLAFQQNSLDYAYDTLHLNRVYGYVMDQNKGLVKLLQLVGFDQEGLLRQHVCRDGVFHDLYIVGSTKADWTEKKKRLSYISIPFL